MRLSRWVFGGATLALAGWAVLTFAPTNVHRPFSTNEAPAPVANSGRTGEASGAQETAAPTAKEQPLPAAETSNTAVNSAGETIDPGTLAKLRASMQAPPPVSHESSDQVTPERPTVYTFKAQRQGGTLTLTGYYPDNGALAAIHQLIRGRFFSEQVVDKLRRADGAPRNYLAGVSFGLEHLARLASGEVTVSGTALELNGEALYEQTAEQIARAVPAISVRGWTGKAEVRLRPSAAVDAEQGRSPLP